MEPRFLNWLCKGFDGLLSIIEAVTAGQQKMPEDNLKSMLGVHDRLTTVINAELVKRSQAPISSTRSTSVN